MTTPNPTTDDQRRVYRGGSWNSPFATYVRVVRRRTISQPSDRDIYVGCRLTQTGCRQQVLKVQP